VAEQRSDLRRWAIIGAEQRLLQISAEAEAIFRSFPELRGRGTERDSRAAKGIPSGGGDQVSLSFRAGAHSGPKRRGPGRPRKRTMSAEARRRISEAQKARWAKQKAESAAAAAGKKK